MAKTKYDPKMPSDTFDYNDYAKLRATGNLESLVADNSMRFDSNEDASVFFARELDYIKSQTYDMLYPEFTALSLFPQSSDVNAAAETITFYSYDKTGMAKIIHNYATDLPRADAIGYPTTVPVKGIGASYGYSIQEMRASRYAGKSLDVRKADAARYAIDYEINRIAWAGDEENKLVGVLSPTTNVPVFSLPLNAGGTSTKFVDKTPQECLNDIRSMIEYTATLTKSVEQPDTLALPTEAFLYMSNTPRSDFSDLSIMNWILQNVSRLKQIVEAPELNDDSLITPYPGQGVGFMFKKDPKKFTIETPKPFEQHAIQPKGLEFEVPCDARVAGAVIYYPLSMLIIPGV
jgi:hypothetical protein